MLVKDIREVSSSATILEVYFAKSKRDAIDEISYKKKSIAVPWKSSEMDSLVVEYIYPASKDILEVWVVVSNDVMEDILAGKSIRESISRCVESEDDEYAKHTVKDQIKFDHDVIWSVQFYKKASDLMYAEEIFVLAPDYKTARNKANLLCRAKGYDKQACVVQYAYQVPSFWDKYEKYNVDGVNYGISPY